MDSGSAFFHTKGTIEMRTFTTGSRRDSLKDKAQVERLCFSALEEISKVHTYGDEKYGTANWKHGQPASVVMGSLLRHLFAWYRGEDIDDKQNGSGLNHLLHVAWNSIFLVFMFVRHPKRFEKMDDRMDDFGSYVSDTFRLENMETQVEDNFIQSEAG